MKIRSILKYYLLPENSKLLFSFSCFVLGLLSILASLGMFFISASYNHPDSVSTFLILFVGLWAPTLMGIANYLKK